jgi:predicted Zn-dependent peptidase
MLAAAHAGGLVTVAPAQAPAAAAVQQFTTPDGSRFVLLPAPGMPLVHWAIATLAQDPPGLPGLSEVVLQAALGGTWHSGSRDPARERQALDDLDAVYHAWLANRTDAAAGAELQRLTALVEELGDPVAHGRGLASLPVYRPEILDRLPVYVFVATTVPDALPAAAQRVLERREQSALRQLQAKWVEAVLARAQRLQQDDRATLHAEVLALALPDHPLGRHLEPPGLNAPRRRDALQTWQATQRPERTVHVLHGGFDATAVAALLHDTFRATGLPPSAAPPAVAARPIASLRRSVVPAVRAPTVALAFVLPPNVDRTTLAVASRWLAGGSDSRLGQELPRLGRSRATVSCQAPWPPTIDGQSLLLVEVRDPDGIDGLATQVLDHLRATTLAAPTAAAIDAAMAAVQREWSMATNDPRQLAAAVAEAALLWPRQTPRSRLPDRVDPGTVRQLLAQILGTPPVVVEARP